MVGAGGEEFVPDRWTSLMGSPELREALEPSDQGIVAVGQKLRTLTEAVTNDDLMKLTKLLSTICSYSVHADDWNSPYGPFLVMDGRRTAIPSDLADEDLEILDAIVDLVPEPILRSRIFDILALEGEPKLRPRRHAQQVESIVEHGVSKDAVTYSFEQWDRALTVAVRFGEALAPQASALEDQLIAVASSATDGHLAISAARLLRKHGKGRTAAPAIAEHLESVAVSDNPIAVKNTLDEAASWFRISGRGDDAIRVAVDVVNGLVAEADAASVPNGRGSMVAATLLEEALQRVRKIPRANRESLGLDKLPGLLAQRIRDAGAAALGEMKAIRSETGDLTHLAQAAVLHVRGHTVLEALRRLAEIQPFDSLERARVAAEESISEHPISALVSHAQFAADGRTTYRSPPDAQAELYGESHPVWRQMVQAYVFRVGLLGGVIVPQAWVQVSNEHRLGVDQFERVAVGSPFVPPTHERTIALGLYHGYNGDFVTAAHVLVSSLEAAVRYHLSNSGEATSTISTDGIETELGLAALMKKSKNVEVFGEDITFELRALLCGPVGPNLRNEIAHGLLGDKGIRSASLVYLWWITLKLVFTPYWNSVHDIQATDSREPADPGTADEVDAEPGAQG